MKSILRLTVFVVLFMCLGACSATNRLTMGVTEPAKLPLSSDITKIGIINRSIPSEGNKVVDEIDKILSLEGKNLDKEGAQAAIIGLSDELTRGKRFDKVEIITDIDSQRKGLSVFPGHKVQLNTVIKNGWRVYDPVEKTLLDEYITKDYLTSRGAGINPVKAIEAIIGRKEGVQQISNNLGGRYGLHTKPLRRRVARDYFVRGTDKFSIARRRAQIGDWNGAADLWEQEINNPKMKVAGRAYYNMAIINEINGNLEEAIDWASKAYADYGNNMALNYVDILKRRVIEKQQLNNQLSSLNFD